MGLVFKAFDVSLHREVAIKVMHPALAAVEHNRRRFLREARIAAGINHPNVVAIYAVDEQQGMPYLVMEFVPGITLAERIHRGPPFTQDDLVRIGTQIAAGLAAAHDRGIVHRDIKPANILLVDGREQVKLTDFGLAVGVVDASQITAAGHLVGTPAYMSPEQVSGLELDPRSDLFGLGCVMYAMVIGRSPFQGSHQVEIARKIQEHSPSPLHEAVPGIPKELSAIVHRLLAKSPDRRFQSAQEVIQVLSGNPSPAEDSPTVEQTSDVPRGRGRRSWAIGGVAAAVVALGLASAWGMFHYGFLPAAVTGPAADARTTTVLTVSQAGAADHKTIAAALAQAGPNTTIRILDDATYPEAIQIDRADRWRGLTVEGERAPTLSAPEAQGITILVKDTPGVTLRGLQVQSGDRQHGLMLQGDVSNVTVDRVKFTQPEGALYACIVGRGARATRAEPLRLTNCKIAGWVVLEDGSGEASAFVQVEGNRFEGPGMHVVLSRKVEDVHLRDNLFVGGMGIGMNLNGPDLPRRLRIEGNTFFQSPAWLKLDGMGSPDQEVQVVHNLILEADEVEAPLWGAAALAAAWSFRHNLWEPGPRAQADQVALFAESQPEVRVLSRDQSDPNFLRPPPGSPLEVKRGDPPRPTGARRPPGVGGAEPP